MDEIKYYEQKEEIEESLETLKLGKLEYLDKKHTKIPYVNTDYKQITLEEGEKNFKIRIYRDGFLSEHPNDKKLMEKEYDIEEFLNLINEEKNQEYPYYFERVENTIGDKKLKFLGMNIKKHSTYDEEDDSLNYYEKHIRPATIIYGKKENGDILRIELMESYGLCGSGECTASWGECYVSKVDCIDEDDFIIKPLTGKETIEAIRNEENVLSIDIKNERGTKILSILCDYDGGDSYYPSGNVSLILLENNKKNNITYMTHKDQELLKNSKKLNVDKDKFEKAIDEEEFFDLGNPNKENKKSNDLEY